MSLQGNVVLMNLGFTSYEEAHAFVEKHRKPKAQMPEHSAHASSIAHYHNEVADPYARALSQSVTIRELTFLRDICHGNAVNAGWYTDLATGEHKTLNVGERIALMHSELSEAFEAYRKDLDDDHLPHRKGLEAELADTVIRIFDFAGAENLDLGKTIIEKIEYNLKRADHKLENRRLEGGKKC